MPQISICGSPETEPPEPLETRTLVVRRIFDEGTAGFAGERQRPKCGTGSSAHDFRRDELPTRFAAEFPPQFTTPDLMLE
jgi:hypothetical protein